MYKYILLFFAGIITTSLKSQIKNEDFTRSISLSEKLYEEKRYDSAHILAKKAYNLVINDQKDSLKIVALLNIMLTSAEIAPSRVDSLYQNIILESRSKNLWPLLAETHFRRGRIYYRARDFGAAQPLFLKVDSIATTKNFLNATVIRAILARSEISRTTFTHEGIEQASDLQEEALKKALTLDDQDLIHNIYTRRADMNGLKGNMPEVRKYLDLSFPYYFKKNDFKMLHRLFFTETSYYYELNELDKAEKTIQKSIEYFSTNKALEELASSYTTYGNFFRKRKNNCTLAIPQFKKAQDIYEKNGEKITDRYMYLLEGIALCEAENANYKEAYGYYQKTYETKKQLVKDANNKLTRKLETKYQTQKKEQEIALLTSQNKLAEQQKKNQRNLMLGGLGLTTAAGIFLFLGYRNRKKTNDKLRELDTVKSDFFANISHEFRTPLSLISGPIEQQLQKADISDQERQNLQIAQRNSTRLVTLVDQLLDLSKLESGHFSLKVQEGNLATFLKSLTSTFEFLAQENNLKYTTQISDSDTNAWFDTDIIEKIVTNLIGNAIKYSPNGENISILATITNQKLQLEVKNSGAPLSPEILPTLFNRFQRADETTTGTGIGLALTKELASLHKGTIDVTSDSDWTTFMVSLPISREKFTASEVAESASLENAFAKANLKDSTPSKEQNSKATLATTSYSQEAPFEEVDIFAKDDKPILLIVDDNEDLRTYVSSLFDDTHTIHTAVNGKDGFEKALSEVPDLIITDLMMPLDDGITLTRNCKTSEATSHIPIIMLTAKAGDENQLAGLATGADAYITKPFNTEILKTTVHNLQETRDKLQERFSQEVVLLPKDVATNATDERFLTNLQEVMDKSLVESDFSTEAFAQAVGMSRMQLHRKLKALTGLSATEFIRGQRLKLAAQMLKKSDINVSQVGYAVGFNNHSYFTKCFKEKYGVSPSEYSKKP